MVYLNPMTGDILKEEQGSDTEKGGGHRRKRSLGSSCLMQANELRVVSLSMYINLLRRK